MPISSVILLVLSIIANFFSSSDEGDKPLPVGWNQLTHDGHFKQRPVWSADGSKFLFTRHIGESIQVILCQSDGTNETRLFESPHPRLDAVFLPNSKGYALTFDKVTTGQGDMELYLAEKEGGELKPLFVTEGKLSHEEWASPSPDGIWLACTSTRDENCEIYRVKLDGSEKQRLTSDPALDWHPSVSPDGRKIAFATDRWGDLEIAVIDVETSLVTRLTESEGLDDFPVWSPSGDRIAFASRRSRNLDIWVMAADGTNRKNVTNHEGPDNFPAWTPSGDITFCSYRNGAWDIYRLSP